MIVGGKYKDKEGDKFKVINYLSVEAMLRAELEDKDGNIIVVTESSSEELQVWLGSLVNLAGSRWINLTIDDNGHIVRAD